MEVSAYLQDWKKSDQMSSSGGSCALNFNMNTSSSFR